jgi:CheY-like chemotaxis protein
MTTALVVDDSMTDMQILTGCLRQGGLNVLTANSGEEALTKLVARNLTSSFSMSYSQAVVDLTFVGR